MKTKVVEQNMAGLGSAFLLLPAGYWSGLLGSANVIEISKLRTRRDLVRQVPLEELRQVHIEPACGLVAIQGSPVSVVAPSIAQFVAENSYDDTEIDIQLTAPPIQYGKVLVQLRDVGADKPRIFYDLDQD